jgi:hypothetical protein
MALEVKRKEKENAQSLVRRFTQRMQKSGILVKARKNRYRKDEKSVPMQKKEALRKIELKKQYEKLKKLGKTEKKQGRK